MLSSIHNQEEDSHGNGTSFLDLDIPHERGHLRVLDVKQPCEMVNIHIGWYRAMLVIVYSTKNAWLISTIVFNCC